MGHERMGSGAGQTISSGGHLCIGDELAFVLLGAAGGLAWGLASLIFGISLHLFQIPGPLRLAAHLFILPFSLAGWVGSALQLPLVDPAGLVMATGAILGLVSVAAWLAFERWRDR
jgi:hypothetical protein